MRTSSVGCAASAGRFGCTRICASASVTRQPSRGCGRRRPTVRIPLIAVAGPDAIVVRGAELHPANHSHQGEFVIHAGQTVDLTLTWYPSHRDAPPALDVEGSLELTRGWWTEWASASEHQGPYRDEVVRSLLLLRALSHLETGGIVAAATTSLPEAFGGERNWDYRYVWLRDASLTIGVLLAHGYNGYIDHWRDWLLRAVAGDPGDVQIMYGLAGERDLNERIIDSLPGYQGAHPVRIGNDASTQFQADVIGEVMLALDRGRRAGNAETRFSWALQRALMGYLEQHWREPDHGIWEIRDKPRQFTHSRALVWAAFDCAVRAVEDYHLDGPVERWKRERDAIRADIESNGWDAHRGTYVQHYGSSEVDASLLQLSQVGYIDADDPRMLGTVRAIEQDLLRDGLLLRYRTESGVDGLPPGEHPFLACSFWLVEQYATSGRHGRRDPDDGSTGRPGERRRHALRGIRHRGPVARGQYAAGAHAPGPGSRGGRDRRPPAVSPPRPPTRARWRRPARTCCSSWAPRGSRSSGTTRST